MRYLVLTCLLVGCAAAAGGPEDEEDLDFPDAVPGTDAAFSGSPDATTSYSYDASPPDTVPCTGGDDQTTYPPTGGCYMLFISNVNWANAQAACAALAPTAHLATISDAGEEGVVASLATGREPWIGLGDATEGVYTWVTGEPFSYTDWDSGEPNNSGDCVRMKNGRWADLGCGEGKSYICERQQ